MTPAEIASLLRESAKCIEIKHSRFGVVAASGFRCLDYDEEKWAYQCTICRHIGSEQTHYHGDGCIITRLRKAAEDVEKMLAELTARVEASEQETLSALCDARGYAEENTDIKSERDKLLIALADAIRRPMGVIPDSAQGLVTDDDLAAAEKRRTLDPGRSSPQ